MSQYPWASPPAGNRPVPPVPPGGPNGQPDQLARPRVVPSQSGGAGAPPGQWGTPPNQPGQWATPPNERGAWQTPSNQPDQWGTPPNRPVQFGEPPNRPDQPAIARYAAPHRPSGLLILLVAFVAIVGVAVILATSLGRSGGAAAPTTPVPSAGESPTTGRTGGTTIDQGGVRGYWKVTSTHWTAVNVTIRLAVTVDHGVLACQFFAFDDASANLLNPLPGDGDSLDSTMYVSAGQTLTGSLTFSTTRRDLTLIMTDGDVQLSALSVPA